MLSNKKKLELAVWMLQDISANWNEEEVVNYPKALPDFEELVVDLGQLELRERR